MATRPSYFRERARNPYLRARPPAPGLEEEDPNASPLAPADFLATSPRRAVAPQSTPTFDPNQAVMALLPALRAEGGSAQPVQPDVGSLAFLPPPTEAFATPPPRAVAPPVDPIETARAAYQTGTPTTFGGNLKQSLLNAGLGFLQAASRDRENPIAAGIGGAATGGIISAASPRTGRGMLFEQLKRPEIEYKLQREEALRKKQEDAEDRALKREGALTDIGYKRAQIGELGSRPEIARENARRQAAIAESQVALNNARAEAARTGNPSYVDVDEGGGKITKYQVFPNGMMRPVGASGSAAINRANIKSREGIAARREAGVSARASAARQEKGQKKVIPMTKIREAVKASNGKMTTSEVKAKFIEQGYRIVE